MHVLIYAHSFAPRVGGVETYLRLLAEGLSRRAVRVTLVTPTPAGEIQDARFPFPVVRAPEPAALRELVAQADVVHLAGPVLGAGALAVLQRKPLLIEHHGYQAVCPTGLLFDNVARQICPGHFAAGRLDRCLWCNALEVGAWGSVRRLALMAPRRALVRLAAANVGVSQHVTARLRLPRAATIRHGLPDPLGGASPRPAEDGRFVFGFVGRLVEEKGVDLLVGAARLLAQRGFDFEVRIVGEGGERPRLEDEVRRAGLEGRVAFLGRLLEADLERAVAAVTAVVLPSRVEETAGLAAVEHMLLGRPVIVADVGGLAEYVGDAGLRFPVGDREALASCMERLLVDRALREELGARARARALASFSLDRMVQEHVALYESLLA